MHQYLKGRDKKYALLFKFGLNTGLRISDFLPLKVKDIYLGNGMFKEHLDIKERKTAKEKKIKINSALQKTLSDYIRTQQITLRYIGINQDQKYELYSLVQF